MPSKPCSNPLRRFGSQFSREQRLTKDGPQSHLPIITIGASAGGLEACRALPRDMPGDVPAALILNLPPNPAHYSMMVGLVAHHTKLDKTTARHLIFGVLAQTFGIWVGLRSSPT